MKKTMAMVAAKMTLSWETWLGQQQQRMQKRTPAEVLLLPLQAQSGRSLCGWMWQVR
jgi:hypothetical protein